MFRGAIASTHPTSKEFLKWSWIKSASSPASNVYTTAEEEKKLRRGAIKKILLEMVEEGQRAKMGKFQSLLW
jgi:hypothetical protein